MGRFGQKFTWPDDVTLVQFSSITKQILGIGPDLFLRSKRLQTEFINRWCWVISNPSHGAQGFLMDAEQGEAVDTFKLFVQVRSDMLFM